jgi:hypothetical protein
MIASGFFFDEAGTRISFRKNDQDILSEGLAVVSGAGQLSLVIGHSSRKQTSFREFFPLAASQRTMRENAASPQATDSIPPQFPTIRSQQATDNEPLTTDPPPHPLRKKKIPPQKSC